jgi:hypothetical protein
MRHGGLAVPSGGGPGSVDLSHTVAAGRAHRSDRMASADLPLMPMSGCYSGRVNVGTRHRRRGRPALQPASTASIHRGRQPRAHIRIERANDDDTEGASRSRSTLFTGGIRFVGLQPLDGFGQTIILIAQRCDALMQHAWTVAARSWLLVRPLFARRTGSASPWSRREHDLHPLEAHRRLQPLGWPSERLDYLQVAKVRVSERVGVPLAGKSLVERVERRCLHPAN